MAGIDNWSSRHRGRLNCTIIIQTDRYNDRGTKNVVAEAKGVLSANKKTVEFKVHIIAVSINDLTIPEITYKIKNPEKIVDIDLGSLIFSPDIPEAKQNWTLSYTMTLSNND